MKKMRVGVIPAAGKGSRISDLPLTRVLPKPMLPLLDKPLIEYVLENMKRLGIETVYIVVGYKKELLKEYFGNGKDWNVNVEYVEQRNPKGIAHAISLVEDWVNEPFATILGDDFTITKSLSNITEAFWKNGAWAVEGIVPENDIEALKRTCCVSLEDDGRIKEIIEKPTKPKSRLRGTGVYLFHPRIFEFIRKTPISQKRNEKEITDTIGLIMREGKAYGALIDGVNLNVNTLTDLSRATEILLNHVV